MSTSLSRFLPAGVYGLALFLAYIASGIILHAGDITDEDEIFRVDLITIIVVGVMSIAAGVWWGGRGTVQRFIAEAGFAIVVSGVVAVVVGPLIGGEGPFADGFGYFIGRLVFFWVVTFIGAWLGLMMLMVAGIDHRSRQLKRTEAYYRRKQNPKGAAVKKR